MICNKCNNSGCNGTCGSADKYKNVFDWLKGFGEVGGIYRNPNTTWMDYLNWFKEWVCMLGDAIANHEDRIEDLEAESHAPATLDENSPYLSVTSDGPDRQHFHLDATLLDNEITNINNELDDHEDRIDNLEEHALMGAQDTATVDHTVSDSNILTSQVKISGSADNMLSANSDGLFVDSKKYQMQHFTMSIPASQFQATPRNPYGTSPGMYAYRTTNVTFTLPAGLAIGDQTIPPIMTARVLGNSLWASVVDFQSYVGNNSAQIDVQIFLDRPISETSGVVAFPQIIDLWMFVEEV